MSRTAFLKTLRPGEIWHLIDGQVMVIFHPERAPVRVDPETGERFPISLPPHVLAAYQQL